MERKSVRPSGLIYQHTIVHTHTTIDRFVFFFLLCHPLDAAAVTARRHLSLLNFFNNHIMKCTTPLHCYNVVPSLLL